jgi:predicted HNH restriction endonuclease
LSAKIDESAFAEGQVQYSSHRRLERDSSITRKAKAKRLAETGRLECDVCGTDFAKAYGSVGIGFIEAHHTKPVSALDSNEKTKLSDLALVCSNCHRMLHRGKPLLSVSQLKDIYHDRAIT